MHTHTHKGSAGCVITDNTSGSKGLSSDAAGLWPGGTSCPADGRVLTFVLLLTAFGARGRDTGVQPEMCAQLFVCLGSAEQL